MLAVIAPGPTGEEWRAAYRELARWLVRPECTRVLVVMGPPGAGKSSWIARQRDSSAIAFEGVWSDRATRSKLALRIAVNDRLPVCVWLQTARWVCARRRPGLLNRVHEAHRAIALDPPRLSEGWGHIITVPHGFASESPWRPHDAIGVQE